MCSKTGQKSILLKGWYGLKWKTQATNCFPYQDQDYQPSPQNTEELACSCSLPDVLGLDMFPCAQRAPDTNPYQDTGGDAVGHALRPARKPRREALRPALPLLADQLLEAIRVPDAALRRRRLSTPIPASHQRCRVRMAETP